MEATCQMSKMYLWNIFLISLSLRSVRLCRQQAKAWSSARIIYSLNFCCLLNNHPLEVGGFKLRGLKVQQYRQAHAAGYSMSNLSSGSFSKWWARYSWIMSLVNSPDVTQNLDFKPSACLTYKIPDSYSKITLQHMVSILRDPNKMIFYFKLWMTSLEIFHAEAL